MPDAEHEGVGPASPFARVLLVLVLAVAAVRSYRAPYQATGFQFVPDSVEYAVGAQRLATLGRVDCVIEGQAYPLRYPPWFPALLAPAYLFAPHELGAGIVVVLACTLAAVAAAFSIGRRLAGEWGAVGAAVALVSLPLFGMLSREIMTEVPVTACVLWSVRLFIALHDRAARAREPRASDYWAAGSLAAAATALRIESAAIVLPFLWFAWRARPRPRAAWLALLLPLVLLGVATALHQHLAFGDWRRNGYMFWCPIPCDYPSLTFKLDYVAGNLQAFTAGYSGAWLLGGVLGAALLFLRRSSAVGHPLTFAVLGLLPSSVMHLFFFYADVRFHLPLIALACAVGGAGLLALVPPAQRARLRYLPALLALAPLALPKITGQPPDWRIAAQALTLVTPSDAVIVSGIDPVSLEPLLLRGTQRRIVPVSRAVEYASKAVAWKRVAVLDPPPRSAVDHRAAGLLRGGAQDVVEFTADERPELLAQWVRAGVPVYFDRSFLRGKFPVKRVRELGIDLVPDARHRWIERLVARK